MQKIPRALAMRHKQSAIVSTMMIAVTRSMRLVYQRKRNFSAVVEDMLVAMAVRENDEAGREPLTIAAIADILNMPRSNAKRAVDAVVAQGVIRREKTGYIGDLDFLKARADAIYFKEAMAAILTAADELRATMVS
jgi:hypothetical protein